MFENLNDKELYISHNNTCKQISRQIFGLHAVTCALESHQTVLIKNGHPEQAKDLEMYVTLLQSNYKNLCELSNQLYDEEIEIFSRIGEHLKNYLRGNSDV